MNPDELAGALQAVLARLDAQTEQLNSLRVQVEQIQAQPRPTPLSPHGEDLASTPSPGAPENTTKSEKLPDPPMFGGNRKELRPFVSKLRMKLDMNADRFPTERSKLVYGLSRLDNDAARTMDPFYRNGGFQTLEDFITLLERTYDDASREHTATTKLENLRQRNKEFTSFFSEFLGLVGELDWNESAKVAALRRAISDEIRAQLVGKDLPKTVAGFATLCQRIDEDLRFNRTAQSLKPRSSTTTPTTRSTTPSTTVAAPRLTTSNPRTDPTRPRPVHDPMDIDTTNLRPYAPARSDERKNRFTKGECFGCGKPGHIQRDCPTHPFERVRAQSPQGVSLPPRSVARVPASRATQHDLDLSGEESENEASRD